MFMHKRMHSLAQTYVKHKLIAIFLFLSYVAKEREQELKETWAQGKFNKSQARQKYGF